MPTTARRQRPNRRYAPAGLTGRAQRRQDGRSLPIMMGTIATLVGLGSVAVMSLTCAGPVQPSRQAPAGIQGAQALRLDLLRQASWPFAPARRSHRQEDPSLPPGLHPTGKWAVNPAAGSRESSIKVVCEFYRWLHADPSVAVPLAAPGVLGDEFTAVARSWADVTVVRPRDVQAQPDGSVLAEVLVEYPDGGRLLLKHRLTVQPGPQPRITRIELVMARSFRS